MRSHTLSILLSDFFGATGTATAASGAAAKLDIAVIARAVARSSMWSRMPDATLLVRSDPEPVLAVIGDFDEAETARLRGLQRGFEQCLSRLRYVGYAEAERDCEALAGRLLARFGRDEIRRFRFTAIPRGGCIVLGMLSYALDLDQEQIEPPHPKDAPIVIVDDCALTGLRFGRFLQRLKHPEAIFATLYSHPELRAAIREREPSVAACISARDLYDFAPGHLGAQYESWRNRSLALGGGRYWVGQTEHVCFAWSEPDYGFWNGVTEQLESGWQLMPPELCLKNRCARGSHPIPVQLQPKAKGPLRPPPQVLFGEFQGQVVIGSMDSRASFAMNGAAAAMWKAIIDCGSLEEAATRLLVQYDVDESVLRSDLRKFVDDLTLRGLIEGHEATDSSS